jgi:hypothetical protein
MLSLFISAQSKLIAYGKVCRAGTHGLIGIRSRRDTWLRPNGLLRYNSKKADLI